MMARFILLVEWFLVADMSAFFFFGIMNKHLAKLLFFGALGLYAILRAGEKKKRFLINFFESTPLDGGFVVFLFAALLATFVSQDYRHSVVVLTQRYIPYCMLFYIGVRCAKKETNLRVLIVSLIAGTVFVSIGGVYDFMMMKSFTRLFTSFGRISLWANGYYFLFTLPFLINFALFHKDLKLRRLAAVSSIPVFLAFFFHYARNTWIALIIAVIAGYSLFKDKRKLAVWFSVTYLIFIFLVPFFRVRLYSVQTFMPETWGRSNIWMASRDIFFHFPVFGSGPGTCEFLMKQYAPVNQIADVSLHTHAHNMYLELLAETGIVGLLAFLSIFLLYFSHIPVALKRRPTLYGLSFFMVVVSLLIGDFADSSLLVGVFIAGSFWFLFGLSVGHILPPSPASADHEKKL